MLGRPASLPFAAFLLLCRAAIAQPPAIGQNGVMNAASLTPPTLPGGVLARGARIYVDGVRLGGRILIAHESRTAEAQVIAADSSRMEAIVPAGAPLGSAELRVQNDGGTSAPFPVIIVEAAPGLYSQNGQGWGPARGGIQARPGQRIVLEATGSGGASPHIFVGGLEAKVIAVLPSRANGIEQLEIETPPKAPEGCFVPVYAQSGDGVPGNVVTVEIRSGNGACKTSIPQPSEPRVGLVVISRTAGLSENGRETWTDDDALAAFVAKERGPAITPGLIAPPVGTCTAYTGSSQTRGAVTGSLSGAIVAQLGGRGLQVGPALQAKLGDVSRVIPVTPGAPGYYRAPLGTTVSRLRPLFLDPGSLTLIAPGGRDEGAFTAQVDAPEPFEWVNRDEISEVRRDQPLSLRWSPGRRGQVALILATNTDPQTTAHAAALCVADAAGGGFTIPAALLRKFPRSPGVPGQPVHQLAIAMINVTDAKADGLDALRVISAYVSGRIVPYR